MVSGFVNARGVPSDRDPDLANEGHPWIRWSMVLGKNWLILGFERRAPRLVQRNRPAKDTDTLWNLMYDRTHVVGRTFGASDCPLPYGERVCGIETFSLFSSAAGLERREPYLVIVQWLQLKLVDLKMPLSSTSVLRIKRL